MRLRRGTVLSIFLKICITIVTFRPCHPIGEWSKLRLVQVIFNNGDRSSSTDYPNMPDRSQQWPEGPGQLTPIGMLQQYALGTFLRSRYTDYLDKQYSRHQIRVESADVDSRLMSAQCHLAGLYPSLSLRLPMQPVPIHALLPDYKHMLEFDEPCRRYNILLHKATQSKYATTLRQTNKEFMTEVTEATGWTEATLKNMGKTYDALYCSKAHGISLPKWANQSVFEKLGHLAAEQYRLQASTPEMRRLRAGAFLNMMLQRMLGKASKVMDARMKFYVYSSHDSMLAQIMTSLGVDIDAPLSRAAALIFELEEIRPDDLIVRILYRNSSTSATEYAEQLHLLQLPGCSVDCPLKTFHQIVAPMCMTKDWHKECACDDHFKGRKIGVTLLICVMILGISVILYIMHNLHKRRRTMQDEGYVRTFDNYGSATDML